MRSADFASRAVQCLNANERGKDSGMKLLRLYADAAGESHFADCEVSLNLRQFAPPAAPFQISDAQAATQLFMLELPPGWIGEMHVSPKRQFMFCLTGSLKVTSSTGDVRFLNPGE